MNIPPSVNEYTRQLIQRNGPGAVRALQGATRAGVQLVKSNPRIVLAIASTSGQTALRAAGIGMLESISLASMAEAMAAAPAAVVGASSAGIILTLVLALLLIWVLWTCVSYWNSLPPKERGFSVVKDVNDLKNTPLLGMLSLPVYGSVPETVSRAVKHQALPAWTRVELAA